jgi:haloalkane dehalogenase
MSKVLLTTVFQPFGIENKYNKKGDDFLLDYLASRLTREPGLFSLSSYVPHSSLHLLAANLPVESTVMEYPTLEEFIEEIKKGYDYVGISFMIKGFRKVFRMIALTRKYSPGTKIIIGGFGTCLHNIEDLGADYVCKGEGVRFMRNILGFPEDMGVTNPEITVEVTLKVLQDYPFVPKSRMGLITSGFGCPNACEFCCTSAYYGHQHIPFLETGRDIYETMLKMNRSPAHKVNHFLIFEEDFMLYDTKVRELGSLIREDRENRFNFACFASVKSLTEFDPEELVAMGMGHVWIGIESVEAPFMKRVGKDIETLFHDFHSLGITTTGSTIFGLEHHTMDNLSREVDFVNLLQPTTVQLSNLMPAEGSPLRERLEKEGRIRKVGFKDADLYSEVIDHPNFKPGELTGEIFKGYERIYHSLGPSIYRVLETWFSGYKNLRSSHSSVLRDRAEQYAQKVSGISPIFLNTSRYLPNDDIRERVKDTLAEIESELGPFDSTQVSTGELIGKIFDLEYTKKQYLEEKPIEPQPVKSNYSSDFFYRDSKGAVQ